MTPDPVRGSRLARRWWLVMGAGSGERGVIAVLAAIILTVMITAGALALDIAGRVSEERRDQATADLAALDASRTPTDAQALAAASALRNGVNNAVAGYGVTATTGTVTTSNGVLTFTPGSGTAVQVQVSTPYNDFLGGTHSHLWAKAVAQNTGASGFSIGSTLVDINAGLGKFGSVSLGAVGYQGLASGNVTLGALATQLGFGALTPDNVLTSQVSVGQLVNAEAALLGPTNPAYSTLTALGASLLLTTRGSSATLSLGSILGLQTGQGVGLGTSVNLIQALNGAVTIANGNAAIGANVALTVAGVADASFSLTGIVPPTSVWGPVGITATNTQVTVNLSITLNIGLAVVQLPLQLTLGGATGTLKAVDCSGTTASDIKVGTTFQTVNATTSSGTVKILAFDGSVSGSVMIPSNPVADTTLNYPSNFTPTGTAVTVNSTPGSPSSNFTGSGLTGGLAAATLNVTVNSVMPGLVTAIVGSLTSSLGITIGNADYLGLQPPAPQCTYPRLVK